MRIRHSSIEDIPHLMAIYSHARAFMAAHANPNQWGPNHWPPQHVIEEDIQQTKSYVCLNEENHIVATFFYDFREEGDVEPTYQVIHDGHWLANAPYGVVHRIASNGTERGAASFCLEWALNQCGDLRIDTHYENIPMQRLLQKLGFTRCGTIFIHEGRDPRLAYEKILTDDESGTRFF
ncbi:MAG: GNAT family protein [Peptoniphilaceae bacterium]|nr:GNAT family protein [Peptoniphilaceae bacterium]